MGVKTELSEYKGNKLISIWEIDENGEKTGDYPIISFGKKKARVIVECIDEITTFIEE